MTTRTILVVDDERNIRRSLEMILSGEGYDVVCVADGQEALDTVARRSVEAVLLDIVMSGLNGIEVLKQLRLQRPRLQRHLVQTRLQDALQAAVSGIAVMQGAGAGCF